MAVNFEVFYRQEGIEPRQVMGDEWLCLCPFHDNHNPSFCVNVKTGLYVCYACGAKGNAYQFYAERHGVSVKEAQKMLDGDRKKEKVVPEEEVRSWHQRLLASGAPLKYLLEERMYSRETISRFQLGYDGSRITIPITTVDGVVVNVRKWDWRHRSRKKFLPYARGFNEARLFPEKNLRHETLLLVEGEPDCILANQVGYAAITATGGAGTWKSDWTERFRGKNVWICYDTDEKGWQGAQRIARTLSRVCAEVKVVELPVDPPGKDFTDYIRAGGTKEELDRIIAGTEPLIPEDQDERENLDSSLVAEALKNVYEVVGHRDHGQELGLVLWSKKRRAVLEVPVTSASKIAGKMSVDIGPAELWLSEIIPGFGDLAPRTQIVLANGWLCQACQSLVLGTRPVEHMRSLGQGLHCLEERAVLISGNRVFVKEYGQKWREWESPIVDGFLAKTGGKDWLPWSFEDLNRELLYSPEQARWWLEKALRAGWLFEQESDYTLHSLYPFALTLSSCFPRKPLVHVRAHSSSGKSRLVLGYYAGAQFPAVGGPFVVNSGVEVDVSEAGLKAKYDGAGLVLILDEQELSEQRHVQEILSLLRVSTYGNAGRVRGTRDGGYRETSLNVAAVLASIDPVSEKDQDANRWLVTELRHEDERPRPEDSVLELWLNEKVDLDELRRSVFLGLVDAVPRLREAYERFAKNAGLPNQGLLDSRAQENIWPVLAAAGSLRMDVPKLASKIFLEKAVYHRENVELRVGNRLLDTLLNAPFDLVSDYETVSGEVKRRNERTTLAVLLAGDWASPLAIPQVGVALERDIGTSGRVKIWVNWTGVQKAILAGTEFSGMSTRRLCQYAKDAPGFEGSDVLKRFGNWVARFSCFRLDPEREYEACRFFGEEDDPF